MTGPVASSAAAFISFTISSLVELPINQVTRGWSRECIFFTSTVITRAFSISSYNG
jgi:hypothetical protein